jgi:hypothetical protein
VGGAGPSPPAIVRVSDLMSRRRSPPLKILAIIPLAIVVMRRRGYRMGGNVVVRCRAGHLFTTIWVPFASFKSVRLGWWRFQRCPVGRHWTLVSPVRESGLTEDERRIASQYTDVRIP